METKTENKINKTMCLIQGTIGAITLILVGFIMVLFFGMILLIL